MSFLSKGEFLAGLLAAALSVIVFLQPLRFMVKSQTGADRLLNWLIRLGVVGLLLLGAGQFTLELIHR